MEFWDHLFLFKRLYDQTMDPIAQQWDLTRIRRGWLERSYLPGNRKSAHLRLLPASSSAVADGQAAQAALRVQLSQGMTTEERAALESAFTRIGENLRLAFKGDA